MFTIEEREALRSNLIDVAREDSRISGAAITGSSSVGAEDRWSDIDLAFGIREGIEVATVLAEYGARMYREYDAIHHVDVTAGGWIYRVFLLANTLQVDLAFAPEAEFGARASTFRLVFGSAVEKPYPAGSTAEELIGWAWLYALHARSSIARNRPWQAEYMISGMRDQVFALACLRHGVSPKEGRGIDDLPAEVKATMEGALVRSIETDELRGAFESATDSLIREVRSSDGALADCLEKTLRELAAIRAPEYRVPAGRQ